MSISAANHMSLLLATEATWPNWPFSWMIMSLREKRSFSFWGPPAIRATNAWSTSVDHLYYHVDRARLRIKVWPIIFLQRMPQNGIKEVIPLISWSLWLIPLWNNGGLCFLFLNLGNGQVTLRLGHKRQTRTDWSSWMFLMEPSHHALRKPKQSQEKDTCQYSGQQLQLMSLQASTIKHHYMWVNESATNSGPGHHSVLSSWGLRHCVAEKPSLLCLSYSWPTEIPWS